jgi:hypothetical protein
MNYLAIGLFIILITVIYFMYYYLTNPTLTSGLHDLNKQITVTYDKLINPNSLTYSYQCWIYISSPPSTTTPLFCRENLSSKVNEFEVDLTGQTLSVSAGTGDAGNTLKPVMTITNNFPIQQWTYLVINVYNLKTFEAYINGKLVKTVNNTQNLTPSSKTSSLFIGNGGLSGYVTKFIRTEKALEAQTIWTTYLSGNGLSSYFSSFIPYGLNMSISKGEDIQRVVKIF